MLPTQDESAELKRRFKAHFRKSGYNSDLPADLEEAREKYPCEWAEACDEFERWGVSA